MSFADDVRAKVKAAATATFMAPAPNLREVQDSTSNLPPSDARKKFSADLTTVLSGASGTGDSALRDNLNAQLNNPKLKQDLETAIAQHPERLDVFRVGQHPDQLSAVVAAALAGPAVVQQTKIAPIQPNPIRTTEKSTEGPKKVAAPGNETVAGPSESPTGPAAPGSVGTAGGQTQTSSTADPTKPGTTGAQPSTTTTAGAGTTTQPAAPTKTAADDMMDKLLADPEIAKAINDMPPDKLRVFTDNMQKQGDAHPELVDAFLQVKKDHPQFAQAVLADLTDEKPVDDKTFEKTLKQDMTAIGAVKGFDDMKANLEGMADLLNSLSPGLGDKIMSFVSPKINDMEESFLAKGPHTGIFNVAAKFMGGDAPDKSHPDVPVTPPTPPAQPAPVTPATTQVATVTTPTTTTTSDPAAPVPGVTLAQATPPPLNGNLNVTGSGTVLSTVEKGGQTGDIGAVTLNGRDRIPMGISPELQSARFDRTSFPALAAR